MSQAGPTPSRSRHPTTRSPWWGIPPVLGQGENHQGASLLNVFLILAFSSRDSNWVLTNHTDGLSAALMFYDIYENSYHVHTYILPGL